MRIAGILAMGMLVTACGGTQADASSDEGNGAVSQSEAWLAFADRDKCELAPDTAEVVKQMASVERQGEPYGVLVAKPGSARLPGGGESIEAVELTDDPYQTPGIFLPLEENWNGLPLRGLWVNATARQVLTESLPYDAVDIRLYFEAQPGLRSGLEKVGWKISPEGVDYGDAEPVAFFSQQHFLDSGKLVDDPVDFEAVVEKTGNLPIINGREVGSYAMNTIVQLVDSRAKPGMAYLSCSVYAST